MKKSDFPHDPDKYMWKVLEYVDRNGTVLSKDSSPMHSSLAMSLKKGKLSAKISASAYAQGNGSCHAKIVYDGRRVFEAGGNYTAGPFNVAVSTYVPGSWEKTLGVRTT
jgi:hypothetical protein